MGGLGGGGWRGGGRGGKGKEGVGGGGIDACVTVVQSVSVRGNLCSPTWALCQLTG